MPTNHKRHNPAPRGSASELTASPEQPTATTEGLPCRPLRASARACPGGRSPHRRTGGDGQPQAAHRSAPSKGSSVAAKGSTSAS